MQKSVSGKKKPKIVTKPFATGRAVDDTTVKRSLRVAGSVLVAVVFYLIFGSMLMFDIAILRIITNAALVFMCAAFLYMSGATHGEADVAFGEIIYQRGEGGKMIPDSDRARCFTPLKGVVIALIGAAPFVLLALVNALFARLQTYSLGVLPNWLTAYQRQAEIGDALRYYESTASLGVMDAVRLATRVLLLPFVSIAGSGNALSVLWVERLGPLLSLIVPAGYALGYLRGKDIRARVHTSIAQSKRKKKSKDKKERQRRQQKGPEQLV